MDKDDERKIRDIVAYFCKHYPHPNELSKARLTKLVYLADWRSAIDNKAQITGIDWWFNNYGPYVSEVVEIAKKDSNFRVQSTSNAFGGEKDVISLKHRDRESYSSLDDNEKSILDAVIEATQRKNFNEFIEFVYGTYPVETRPRYSNLNLVELAAEYRKIKQISR